MTPESIRIRTYINLKWYVLLAVSLITMVGTWIRVIDTVALLGIVAGLLVAVIINLILSAVGRWGTAERRLAYFFLALDIMTIGAALYFNGGSDNRWWFLPILIILISGYLFDRQLPLAYALLASVLVSLSFTAEYLELIPHFTPYGRAIVPWQTLQTVTDYIASLTILYLVGALASGYFSQTLRESSEQLETALRESEKARAELESAHQSLLATMAEVDRAKSLLEAKVRERTAEIERARAELETKVKERTADLEESRKAILHMMKNLKEDIVKLQAVDKMKTEFLSMVSHELRTPLTPIKGYLSMLRSGKLGDLNEKQQRSLEILTRQSEHLHSLIDSILDLSRIELGKRIPLSKEPLALRAVIEETVEAMNVQAGEKKVLISVEIQPDLPNVSGDVIQLKRVLANLVGNAIKFSPEAGEIKIKASRNDHQVRVEVIDHGLGISAEHLGKVFEKFYQVDSSVTRAAGGMGMGLPIAKELVALHGGTIWLESDGPGKGTRALFTLPVV
jgi:signal transduction histidine kinase